MGIPFVKGPDLETVVVAAADGANVEEGWGGRKGGELLTGRRRRLAGCMQVAVSRLVGLVAR